MRLPWCFVVSGIVAACSGVTATKSEPSGNAGAGASTGATGACVEAAEKVTRAGPCAGSGQECGDGCGSCDPWLGCHEGRCYFEQGLAPVHSLQRALHPDEGEGERFLVEQAGILERVEASIFREKGDVEMDIYVLCEGSMVHARHAVIPFADMHDSIAPLYDYEPVRVAVEPPLSVAKGTTLDVIFRASDGGQAISGIATADCVANAWFIGYNHTPGIADSSGFDYEVRLFIHPSDLTSAPADAGATWDPGAPEVCAAAAVPSVAPGQCAAWSAECGQVAGQFCGACSGGELCQDHRCFRTVGLGPENQPNLLRGIHGEAGEGQRFLMPWSGTIEYVEAAIWAEPGAGIELDLYRSCGNRLLLSRSLVVPASTVPVYPDDVHVTPAIIQRIDPPLTVAAGDVVNVLLHPSGDTADVIGVVMSDADSDGHFASYDTNPGLGNNDWDAILRLYIHP